jgi:large subunit ribosomal protein L6
MSRIGNTAIPLPQGVTVTVEDKQVIAKGAKAELTTQLLPGIKVEVTADQVIVSRKNDQLQTKANHGLIRSLINNNIIGVSDGFKKTLKLVGTGYRVTAKGAGISLAVGYSHPVEIAAVEGVQLKVEGNDTIHIEGSDKQAVGQLAANIRKVRPPEPYKGKGIRYQDEVVRRKAGKTAA